MKSLNITLLFWKKAPVNLAINLLVLNLRDIQIEICRLFPPPSPEGLSHMFSLSLQHLDQLLGLRGAELWPLVCIFSLLLCVFVRRGLDSMALWRWRILRCFSFHHRFMCSPSISRTRLLPFSRNPISAGDCPWNSLERDRGISK